MNKLSLIIQREYTSRVKKKSFLIMTFVMPLALILIILIPLLLSSVKDNKVRQIAVIDASGLYLPRLQNTPNYQFIPCGDSAEACKNKADYYAYLIIKRNLTEGSPIVRIYSEQQVGADLKDYVQSQLSQMASEDKIASYQIEGLEQIIRDSRVRVKTETIRWTDDGNEQKTSSEISMIIGMITAMLIYFFIFAYGGMVMNGVIEEKSNRIVEIIVSSAKPFQLMMGKIIGIALVGLTQFFLWVVVVLVLVVIGSRFGNIPLDGLSPSMPGTESSLPPGVLDGLQALSSISMGKILFWFVLYFLGGYLLYASLFAAVGGAIDNSEDAQQFTLPMTIPILFALYAGIYGAGNPEGPLTIWCSFIPFTSPIVMMVRLPFGVPFWHLVLSYGLLALTFVFSTKLAAKIYRTGILMYGKKTTYKVLWQWIKPRR
ncbi:MAG TPA: ABC transporter permease [Bacteroidales bacterium]|nr:ABC transporter permease [Bacteroidales bacterium]